MADLLRFLKESPNARKVFGKGELKIIERQLDGINLTQSEKNRLSRDIRAKFKFIKEVSRFEKEFDLKKAARVKERIERALELIREHKDFRKIKEIWLFGSTVENKRTFRSDIDIAVVFDEIDLREATKFRIRILGNFDKKMDVQVFRFLPKKIQKSILGNYRVLYKRSKNKSG